MGEVRAAGHEEKDGAVDDSIGRVMPAMAEEQVRRLRCPVCGLQGALCCSQCRSVFYCTQEHVKEDWGEHKKVCKKIKNKSSGTSAEESWFLMETFDGNDKSQPVIVKGSKVSLHYQAAHINRRPFDDSCGHMGGIPIESTVGKGNLLPALDNALLGMRQGQTCVFCVLANGAYSSGGSDWARCAPIAPEVHMLVSITVVSVK